MAKERRKENVSEDDSSLVDCLPTYSVKSVRKGLKGKSKKVKLGPCFSLIVTIFPSTRICLTDYAYNMKYYPGATIKRTFFKIGFYIWCVVVVISIFSLMGVEVSQPLAMMTFTDRSMENSARRSLQTSTGEEDSLIGWFPSSFNFGSITDGTPNSGLQAKEEDLPEDEDDDLDLDIPEQILPMAPKQGNKLNRKLEKQLSCDEVDCNSQCNAKIKAKCAKSASCRKEREKLCRRRCRKQRCEERCKDEPRFGYVEREQRMEKCKDECSGPTAVHNKCIKKCHSQFKPCKSRCHEIANKFVCDRVDEPVEEKEPENDFSLSSDFDDEVI